MKPRTSFSGGGKIQMERVVAIIDAIQSGSFPNTYSLAAELEVSRKTIQRDIAFMRDRLHYTIEYDEHEYGFYFPEEVDSLQQFDMLILFVGYYQEFP